MIRVAGRTVDDIVADMGAGREIHFSDFAKVCDHFSASCVSAGRATTSTRCPGLEILA